jgi:membrane peptidoglycan carboxypeptidase
MTTVPQIARRRSYKRHLDRNHPSGGVALGCSLLVSLFLLLGGISVSFFYVTLTRDLPSLELFPFYLEQTGGMLHQPTELFDRTGEHVLVRLMNPVAEDARKLIVNRSAPHGEEFFSAALIQATVSSMEPDFWNEDVGLFGGLLDGGENMLAQQLVSDIAFWDETEGILRDLRVRLLASQLIEEFGKEKILEWYLNSATYGTYIHGADAAAQVYLGKSASDLTLEEGALIASIAGAPDINPHTVPELALDRQKSLIQSMLDQGQITRNEARIASEQSINFREPVELQDDFKPFTSFVLAQLASIVPKDRIERGGMKITTSMDFDLQVQAQCALQAYMMLPGSQTGDLSAIDGSTCEAARLLPTLLASPDEFPERIKATVAITDPSEGQLLALVLFSEDVDQTVQLYSFPSGTVLSPFIYLTAFTRGFNTGTMLWDIPGTSETLEDEDVNAGIDEFINSSEPYQGPIRLRTALANDYLRPTLQLMDQIGSENVATTLTRFELISQNSLDTQTDWEKLLFEEDIGLIESIMAYGIFANQGVLAGQVVENGNQVNENRTIELSGILRVEDASGKLLIDWSSSQSRSIVSPQLAYLVSHILSDETARWESMGHPNPLEIGRTAAVKLSRTLDEKGSWVIGYDPERVVGIWIESLQGNGEPLLSKLSAGLWHAIMQYALQEKPAYTWQIPPGISSVEVCDPSGLLPTSNCPYVVTEIFLSGQEPTHADNLFRAFQINRETGNLATVFTPPELIEERVFMVIPPQAEEWALTEDLQLPPENYDSVGVPANTSPNARIDSPEMFSHIKGNITIRGSASGTKFSYYRIQVGQGLNPQEWIQIGEDFSEPVDEDILVTWDTNELSGLYAIRLMVVHQDQRVETAVQQVTVDNQVPEVQILSPQSDQQLSAGVNEILVLRAEAVDDLKVAQVDFFLDDGLLATLTSPPYVVSWEPRIGEHTLVVEAQDMAGNILQDSVDFTINR